MRGLLLLHGLLVACLCLATLAVAEAPWRFETAGDVVTIEPPVSVPEDWLVSGDVSPLPTEAGGGIALSFETRRAIPYVSAVVYRDTPFSHLRIRSDLKAENLHPGREGWQKAQLMVLSYNQRLRSIGYWPRKMLTLKGDGDWRSHDLVFPLHEQTRALRIVLYNGASQGRLLVRQIAYEPLQEKPIFGPLRIAVFALWGLYFAYAAWTLIRTEGHRVTKAALIGLFAIATLAIVMPQPYYGKIVMTLEQLAQDFPNFGGPPALVDKTPGSQSPRAESQGHDEPDHGETAPRDEGPEEQAQPEAEPGPTVRTAPSAAPEERLLDQIGFKEIGHFSMFFLLTLASLAIFRRQPMALILAFMLLYALSTEFLQFFLATRSTSLWDLGINSIGLAAGSLVFLALRQAWPRPSRTARSGASP